MAYARVIPVLRTPLGVESFDYQIPIDLHVTAGDLVHVPFRRGKSVALVEEILTDSPFANKALSIIDRYANIHLPLSVIELLDWTAARTLSSKPSVLKAWLRTLPNREPQSMAHLVEEKKNQSSIKAQWITQPQQRLIERARQESEKRVLILTPWKARTELFQRALKNSRVLHSDLNDGDAFRAWFGFMNGETHYLIATRLGAWLAPFADLVLIDEPENDDHKQDELSPRYDARLMLAWCNQHVGISVESFGLTPPLHTNTTGPMIEARVEPIIRHPNGRSNIPMVQADALEKLIEHTGPRIIVHPIRGMSARLLCRDCGWRAVCDRCGFALSAEADRSVCRQCEKKSDLPLACPSCGGVDLGKSTPGIERLKQAWAKHEPNAAVEWCILSNEDTELPIPKNAIILVTDGSLLGGVVEDVRRRERLCVAFRRLADRVACADATLLIQCNEASAGQWTEWLTNKGLATFQDEQRRERQIFVYPPATRLVKMITLRPIEFAHKLPKYVVISGPFPVKHRSSSRGQRLIYLLRFPPHARETELLQWLTPLASSAIIDLDPVAFFH